ncbi:DUF6414 family protein [Undibacterium sp. Di26W]|uniref:DUF6414 family protein n=1 Tax=Undibacterium sp. Di26W TaxID=3413035 RepID=UPI003BF2ED7F
MNIKEGKNRMIKSFIYLDEQKMYSLSSQIFEGITEYVLQESATGNEATENQKGPVGSGRILADVIKSSIKSTEKKFFHDYSYSIFEKYLLDQSKVLTVERTNSNKNEILEGFNSFSFIKVRLKAVFNDVNKAIHLFENFNEIGQALSFVNSLPLIENINSAMKNSSGKSERNELQNALKKITDGTAAKEAGLYQDPQFLKSLLIVTKYGFSDQFETQQNIEGMLFTSNLKREYLREKEDLLIRKYSRKTEREIVVFGMISQGITHELDLLSTNETPGNMKEAWMNVVEHLANLEKSISGKQKMEIVIDPIAVYVEV